MKSIKNKDFLPFKLRPAKISDIKALIILENKIFNYDQLAFQNFKHFLTRGHAQLIVCVEANKKEIAGYSLVLFRKNSRKCRLYSLAMDPNYRGRGLGKMLLKKSETLAKKTGAVIIGLEVKEDNLGAITLYKTFGFQEIGKKEDYYSDHTTAIIFQKEL